MKHFVARMKALNLAPRMGRPHSVIRSFNAVTRQHNSCAIENKMCYSLSNQTQIYPVKY